MSQRRALVSWIGHTDLRAFAATVPAAEHEELTSQFGPVLTAGELGPVKTLAEAEHFDDIHLLSNYAARWTRPFAAWIGGKVKVHKVELANPTDYAAVFQCADELLKGITTSANWRDSQLCLHLSPGTPTMAAVWLLLGKTRYPATLYQTYRGGATVTDVPFDLVLEHLPELLRRPDLHWQHLVARSPADVQGFEQIVGDSPAIRAAVGRAQRAALHHVPVLILGESGTGKELFARAIHNAGPRCAGSFEAINCAAIPRDMLEAELFGYQKGAFTGANQDYAGAFERTGGGTLFLDEVGECDAAMQSKLLRVLEPPPGQGPCCRAFRRLGGNKEQRADVRLIAATNRDLLAAIAEHAFRDDLYYRLAPVTLKLPALRERRGDIPAIAERLLARVNGELGDGRPGYRHKKLSPPATAFVKRHDWPGNVRQLYNALVQAAVMAEAEVLDRQDLAAALAEMPSPAARTGALLDQPLGDGFNLESYLNDLRRGFLRRAMQEAEGVKARAARLLGIENYQTLDAQLKRLKVEGWQT